jgi:hypothetical protein
MVAPGPEYQNLVDFVEAIGTASAALEAQEDQASGLEQAADDATAKAKEIFQNLEQFLSELHDHFVKDMEAAEHTIEETTAYAGTVVDTEIPAAVTRLDAVAPALDALLDPARDALEAAFKALEAEGFERLSTAVQGASSEIEAADDGNGPPQPFLELPADLHELAARHQTAQHDAAVQLDGHTSTLSAAGDTCHGLAEAGAHTWGHDLVEAVQQHCDQHKDAVRTLYEGWEGSEAPHGPAIVAALEDARRRLTEALATEDRNVDVETEQAQTALDGLHQEMTKADQTMDENGDSVVMDLVETVFPELKVARGVVGVLKELADAL